MRRQWNCNRALARLRKSHRSAPAVALEQKLVLRLHELRKQNPDDGYRRMTQRLLLEGFRVNRKRIARLKLRLLLRGDQWKAEDFGVSGGALSRAGETGADDHRLEVGLGRKATKTAK